MVSLPAFLARKQATQNIDAKKRVPQDEEDSDYLFGNAKKGNAQNQNKISLNDKIRNYDQKLKAPKDPYGPQNLKESSDAQNMKKPFRFQTT